MREVIIRGGENIAPREVEEVLQSHPTVRESAVVGRPDPTLGEQVVAFIVPQKKWDAELAQQVREYAAQRLTPHNVPVDFIAVDSLPHNAVGKVERRKLREQLRQQVSQGVLPARPT